MKKINFKKLMSILSVSILSLGMICFTGCNNEKEPIEELKQEEYAIYLTSSESELVETASEVYIEKTLTATVTAKDSSADTYLNWSAKWSDTSITENVSDYLKVMPTTTGSTTAKVRCYKNFEEFGETVITVTARADSTKYATCVVMYIGIPDSFDIKEGSVSISGTTIIAVPEEPYYYTLDLEHAIGVGSEYGNDYEFEVVSCSGSVYFKCTSRTSSGDFVEADTYGVWNVNEEFSSSENTEYAEGHEPEIFVDFDTYIDSYYIDAEHNELFFTVLNIDELREKFSYFEFPTGFYNSFYFEGVSDDFIFTIKVTEKKLNKSVSFNIHIDIPVSDSSKIPSL